MEPGEAEDEAEDGLGWGEDVEGDEEMEDVVEEEPEPHPLTNVWTRDDMEEVRKMARSTEPAAVEVLSDGDDDSQTGKDWAKGGSKGRYIAPWGKTKKAAQQDWVVKVDNWGGRRFNSGWYEWKGQWYPSLVLASG